MKNSGCKFNYFIFTNLRNIAFPADGLFISSSLLRLLFTWLVTHITKSSYYFKLVILFVKVVNFTPCSLEDECGNVFKNSCVGLHRKSLWNGTVALLNSGFSLFLEKMCSFTNRPSEPKHIVCQLQHYGLFYRECNTINWHWVWKFALLDKNISVSSGENV